MTKPFFPLIALSEAQGAQAFSSARLRSQKSTALTTACFPHSREQLPLLVMLAKDLSQLLLSRLEMVLTKLTV